MLHWRQDAVSRRLAAVPNEFQRARDQSSPQSRVPRANVAWLVLVVACTPVRPFGSAAKGGGDSGMPDAQAELPAAADAGAPVERAGVDDACAPNGARTCALNELRVPLLCEKSSWSRQPPCAADERCETAAGRNQGLCVAIAPECLGRASGTKVCDGELLRTCTDLLLSAPIECAKQQHCSVNNDVAACTCVPGSVDKGRGCEVATDCSVANGGCDVHTACSVVAGERVCGECPAGFSGSGLRGCSPQLSALTLSSGALSPKFAAGVYAYKIGLPLMQQRVAISASGPAGTTFEYNGSKAEAGATWTSPVLPLGEHMVQLRLTSDSGLSTDYDLTIDHTGTQEAYLKAAHPQVMEGFGSSLAIYGDTLAIGAMYNDSASTDQTDTSAADSGAVYVFVRSGDAWHQAAFLKADAPTPNDFFGMRVAIWGDTIAVGVPRASPYGNTVPRGGSVYVFVRDVSGAWTRQAKLAITGSAASDMFGYSLALQQDLLAVGAPYESSGASQSGAVFLFKRDAGAWGAPLKLKATQPTREAVLGWSVALDGDTLVAGAQDHSGLDMSAVGPGSAYVFVQRGTDWTQQQRLQMPQPVDGATFGWSVAIQADTIAVGAPRADLLQLTPSGEVYLFERTADHWNYSYTLEAPVPRTSDYFGGSVALSDSTLVVGAHNDANGSRGLSGDPAHDDGGGFGALHIYGRQDDHWVRAAYVKAANADMNDQFGEHLAVQGDTIVAGAFGESSNSIANPSDNSLDSSGAVYVFR
jgi:hypothetical protein